MNPNGKRPLSALAVLGAILVVVSSVALTTMFDQGGNAYSTRRDLSKVVPYHAAASSELTGEACLQMVFDYWGPSVSQQDIRNVSKGVIDGSVSTVDELVRAAHFSDQSWAKGNLRGYKERPYGYGGFYYDWSDNDPRVENRFTDIYEALTQNQVVMLYMYRDFPPEITPPTNPPTPPQVTPESLAGLEKVWRLVVGYDSEFAEGQFKLHDPLPPGDGARGGADVYLLREDLDRLWNVFEIQGGNVGTYRIGMTACPWGITGVKAPKNAEAGTEFEISANITYMAPPVFSGVAVQNPTAFLKLPEDFTMAEGAQSIDLHISSPKSFQVVTWKVRAPDRTYAGQDCRFYINATGTAVVSDPAHRDRIGASTDLEVEAFGFLNHPPLITSAGVDPDNIPDDGSKQPIFTCLPTDEDGNLYRITIDMSPIGGSEDQRMYDDGKNGGDQIEGDSIYSYKLTREAPIGVWTFKITVRDSKGAEAYANVTLKVDPLSEFTESPEFVDAGVSPSKVPNDGFTTTTIWAIIEDAENDVDRVTADLTSLGGDNRQELNDEGEDGDLFRNDGNYSFAFIIDPMTSLDMYQVQITAVDETGHETVERVWLEVILPPVPPMILDIIVDPITVVNDGKEKVQVIATVEDDNDDVDEVWADLTPLKGSSRARMDFEGGDLWSLEFTVDETVTPGVKGRIDVTAMDMTGLTATGSFSLTVEKANSPPVIDDLEVSAYEVSEGDEVKITVNVSDEENDPLVVTVDLSSFLLSDLTLSDDGVTPDETAEDGIHTGNFKVPTLVVAGNHTIRVTVTDTNGRTDTRDIVILVVEKKSSSDENEPATILYIGIPVIGLLVLIGLSATVLLKNRRGNRTDEIPPGARAPAGGMPPPRGYPTGPMGARPMR
ncbi:MAG: hypothetical protein JXA22_06195 [Candidatus Thermoplasmatota archaeon]|nr:hypothetical protein [Candidatus Thermoplasmatota archaeon]